MPDVDSEKAPVEVAEASNHALEYSASVEYSEPVDEDASVFFVLFELEFDLYKSRDQ